MSNRRASLAASFIAFVVCVASALAQAPASSLAVLASEPAIAPGVDSLPRVVAGPAVSAESAQRINSNLSQYDAPMKFAARECIKPANPIGGEPTHDLYWKRAVRISMRGPRYLSLISSDNYDCGGVHPASGTHLGSPTTSPMVNRLIGDASLVPTRVGSIRETKAVWKSSLCVGLHSKR